MVDLAKNGILPNLLLASRPWSVTWYMIPLLPASAILYSSCSSNQSYWSLVQRSPALRGSTQTRASSLTCQPGRIVFVLKLCHPSRSLPLKSSFQPAFFSSAVIVLAAPTPLLSSPVAGFVAWAASRSSWPFFHSSP